MNDMRSHSLARPGLEAQQSTSASTDDEGSLDAVPRRSHRNHGPRAVHTRRGAPVLVVLAMLALAGCANPVNRRTAEHYFDAGSRAELAGDLVLAERNYDRALLNARIGHSPAAGISMLLYNLGRVKGRLCKFDEARTLLEEALALDSAEPATEPGVMSMRLFELARLHAAHGAHAKAAAYFERALPMVRKLGMSEVDPIALADALEAYARSAEASEATANAMQARDEAKTLRLSNPGRMAGFVAVPYPTECPP